MNHSNVAHAVMKNNDMKQRKWLQGISYIEVQNSYSIGCGLQQCNQSKSQQIGAVNFEPKIFSVFYWEKDGGKIINNLYKRWVR